MLLEIYLFINKQTRNMYFREKLRGSLKQNFEYKPQNLFEEWSMEFLHAKILL